MNKSLSLCSPLSPSSYLPRRTIFTHMQDDAHIPENTRKKFEHQFSVVDADDSKSLSYQEFVMLVLLMFHDD